MKSKTAFLFAAQTLGQQTLFMWTFTFKEVLDITATRARWNHLLTLLKRRWPKLAGLRVFELHEYHGLHVHLITNRWIDVNEARLLAGKAGWGRIHVMRIPLERASYLAKYLSKERPACFKSWRLWAGFGNWEWTKVKDVFFDCAFTRIYRACKAWLAWRGNSDYRLRLRMVGQMEMRTLLAGWEPGFGPDGKPYADCSRSELLGTS
ncbi:MAG: rolling circle replication-associated protein [Verrucomicrobiales bacterium]